MEKTVFTIWWWAMSILAGLLAFAVLFGLGSMFFSDRISSDCVETIHRIDPGPVVCQPDQKIEMVDHDHGIVVCRCRGSW